MKSAVEMKIVAAYSPSEEWLITRARWMWNLLVRKLRLLWEEWLRHLVSGKTRVLFTRDKIVCFGARKKLISIPLKGLGYCGEK